MLRSHLAIGALALSLHASVLAESIPQVISLEFLGETSFETGFSYENTEVGGLSAITYDAANQQYFLLSDDRSDINAARFYTATIDMSDGSLDDGDISFTSVVSLKDSNTQVYPQSSIDPEGLALSAKGDLYLSSEGDARNLIDPFVQRIDAVTGSTLAELPVPAKYSPTADQTSGIRNNLALEALTLTPDGNTLYTGLENALYQDGSAATVNTQSPARILKFNLTDLNDSTEFIYQVEQTPDAPIPADAFSTNGLVELLALNNDGALLALERAFSVGVGNDVRLYEIDEMGNKRLLLNVEDNYGIVPDNLEGMTFGPELADGRKRLLMVSDNNFGATQKTQFLAFAVQTLDNIAATEIHTEDFSSLSEGSWSVYSVASNRGWQYESRDGLDSMVMNGYGADVASDDWLISPALNLGNVLSPVLTFQSRVYFGGGDFTAKISTDYAGGNPSAANWNEISFNKPDDSSGEWTNAGDIDLSLYAGMSNVYLAFHYTSTGTEGGDGAAWNVGDIVVMGKAKGDLPLTASLSAIETEILTSQTASFTAEASNGAGGPYTYSWDFGDGHIATGATVEHQYANAGTYTVSVTATDSAGNEMTVSKNSYITIIQATQSDIPQAAGDLRIATFNAYLNRSNSGDILTDMQAGNDPQIAKVAEILQRVRPDVVLINELDYVADGSAVDAFKANYLKVSQNGADPIDYPYVFLAPSNTGIDSGLDLDNDGHATGVAGDAFGFGLFEGQYGMVLLSRYPIDSDNARTFQKFLWKDMPNAKLPVDPTTGHPWYSEAALDVFRLSSKSHWDVPVIINNQLIHILASHPTPPVFDGDEDRNGTRNHDEIRFWADYIDPENSTYIYDDNGTTGGLAANKRFVILGDLNASPDEGDATDNPMSLLLTANAWVQNESTPTSAGGEAHSTDNSFAATHTADWRMRADYVLPSTFGLTLEQSAVFWPIRTDELYPLIGPGVQSSDHRLVWNDLTITEKAADDVEESTETHSGGGGSTSILMLFMLALLSIRKALQSQALATKGDK